MDAEGEDMIELCDVCGYPEGDCNCPDPDCPDDDAGDDDYGDHGVPW